MKNKAIYISFFLIFLLSYGCSPEIKIDEYKDPTKTITIKKNTQFAIVLESNRTTGYMWQLAEPLNENILKLKNSEYIQKKPSRIGSGGEERWVFKALIPGKEVINFKYVRPWEETLPLAKKADFTILIK